MPQIFRPRGKAEPLADDKSKPDAKSRAHLKGVDFASGAAALAPPAASGGPIIGSRRLPPQPAVPQSGSAQKGQRPMAGAHRMPALPAAPASARAKDPGAPNAAPPDQQTAPELPAYGRYLPPPMAGAPAAELPAYGRYLPPPMAGAPAAELPAYGRYLPPPMAGAPAAELPAYGVVAPPPMAPTIDPREMRELQGQAQMLQRILGEKLDRIGFNLGKWADDLENHKEKVARLQAQIDGRFEPDASYGPAYVEAKRREIEARVRDGSVAEDLELAKSRTAGTTTKMYHGEKLSAEVSRILPRLARMAADGMVPDARGLIGEAEALLGRCHSFEVGKVGEEAAPEGYEPTTVLPKFYAEDHDPARPQGRRDQGRTSARPMEPPMPSPMRFKGLSALDTE